MDSEPRTSVDVNDLENYADITETNYEDDKKSCVDSNYSGKYISITTAAKLSAQIMNLPLKEFKETISREQIENHKVHDILSRLKEAYDACTCRICECLVGKPNHSQSQPCNCKPCDCKDCVSLRRHEVLDEIKNTGCSCQPCECIACAKLNKPAPCDCEPCQCMVCQGMANRRNKTLIVAPVRQGSQLANCLCAPCDCPRCRQRTLNMSLSRVHEMSTGINRHPNCHCEVCIDDSCQPNGTETCGCQIRRHGIIRKPVEKNPHDFDIRRTMLLNNPIKTNDKKGSIRTISMFSALEKTKYPSYSRAKVTTSECNCSRCECIACEYKHDLTNSNPFLDRSLRTLKLPSTDFTACSCSPCECLRCISKKYEQRPEPGQLKSCSCDICNCIYCKEAPKPGKALSSITPVSERLFNKFEPSLGPTLDECNECFKIKCHGDVCHCDIGRCIKCTDKGDVSEEGLYPIKKGELLTPSRMRTDPISELELPSHSSEYTQLKHSKGQSNVFKRDPKASDRTKPEFTVLHLVPSQRTNQLSLTPTTPSKSDFVGDKLDSSDNILRIKLPEDNTVTYVSQCYHASTSKTLSAHTIVKKTDNISSYHKSKTDSAETACFYDSTRANKDREYQNSPPTSVSSSKQGFQNLTPSTSIRKNNTSQQLLLKKKVEQVNGNLEAKKEAPSKEVTFVLCTNGEQHGSALHDCYGRQALLHKTNVYTALPSSDFNVEENSAVLEEPSYKDDYILENSFYWNLDHSCTQSLSENTIDYQLFNNKTYKTALATLEKSRNFSLELVKLLEQYEIANLEFESISNKLKQSHDLVFDDFDLCSQTCRGINSKIKSVGFLASEQNNNDTMTKTVDSSSYLFIRENASELPGKTPSKVKKHTDVLESNAINQAENWSAKIFERSKEIDNRICSMTASYNSSTTGLIRLIDEELMVKNCRHSLSNRLIGSKEQKLFISPHADKKTEDLESLIGTSKIKAKMKPKIQNTLEYVIDKHNKETEFETKLNEEIPKVYIIHDEERFKPVQISCDINPKSSSYCNTQALENLPNGVKDLLKIPQLQQTLKKDGSSKVRHIGKEKKFMDDWSYAKPFLVRPVGPNKECNAKVVTKDATSGTDFGKKVQLCSLRKVSDHSVLIKWETPISIEGVEGYEILVDGRAAQKIFSPARCMAVVTCLPRFEPVLLTIRTLTKHRMNGKLPSTTISYRPRPKHTSSILN